MQSAEYLCEATLIEVWNDFDAWTRGQIAAGGEGLSGFLKRRRPLAPGGRVCFHLGENRRSTEHPFAFMATYAPSVVSGSRIQYQPLSRALRKFAGPKTIRPWCPLLSPVDAGVTKERPGEGTGRKGRPLPGGGLDSAARLIASSRTRPP